MRFWRGKKEAARIAAPKIETSETAEPAEARETVPETVAPDISEQPASSSTPQDAVASNVVAITSASKLSERLAAAGLRSVQSETSNSETGTIDPLDATEFPGQGRAMDALRRALATRRAAAHILVSGQPGTGRHALLRHLLEEFRRKLQRPADWVYLSETGRKLAAFSLPHGQGALFVREVEAATANFTATLERLQASDDYRLASEVIDEEFRQRNDKALDDIKRRAESQNIALVKTAESFLLAPMHEGKVVRPEVFRALPESMQREVESKIAVLESELKSYVEALAAAHASHGERLATLERETAARAAGPQIDAVRSAFGDTPELLSAIQAALVRTRTGAGVLPVQTAQDFSAAAPVVFVHDVSANALLGEAGYDPKGRAALRPGALSQANGGFLVIDAWRLAANPEAWSALTAAMETKQIKPLTAPGVILDIEAVPLTARIVIVGEPQSLAKLEGVDTGFRKYFSSHVRLEAAASTAELGADTYAKFAARLAKELELKPLASNCAEALYKGICKRAGKPDTVPLDSIELGAILTEADQRSDADKSETIRRADVEEALRELSKDSV